MSRTKEVNEVQTRLRQMHDELRRAVEAIDRALPALEGEGARPIREAAVALRRDLGSCMERVSKAAPSLAAAGEASAD